MRVPVIQGIIARRLLVNYRVDPAALQRILPPPFRPQLVNSWGVAGICLIGLRGVRPRGFPETVGISSENAAHRIAVEWEERGATRRGVYIPRRDTSAWLNVVAGGRVFPAEHNRARFAVRDEQHHVAVSLESRDGLTRVAIEATDAESLPASSVFASMAEASAFFEGGALGYSVTRRPRVFDGLELRTTQWCVTPLSAERITSSYFDDNTRFPPGSATFDCALIMRNVPHEWHAQPSLCAPAAATQIR